MHLMRQQTQAILNSAGTTATGRQYMTINDAMNLVVPKLAIADKPFDGAYHGRWTYSPDSHEGHFGGATEVAAAAQPN